MKELDKIFYYPLVIGGSEKPPVSEEEYSDPIDEIIAYVMNTPGNTNPVILKQMILKVAPASNEPLMPHNDKEEGSK